MKITYLLLTSLIFSQTYSSETKNEAENPLYCGTFDLQIVLVNHRVINYDLPQTDVIPTKTIKLLNPEIAIKVIQKSYGGHCKNKKDRNYSRFYQAFNNFE